VHGQGIQPVSSASRAWLSDRDSRFAEVLRILDEALVPNQRQSHLSVTGGRILEIGNLARRIGAFRLIEERRRAAP